MKLLLICSRLKQAYLNGKEEAKEVAAIRRDARNGATADELVRKYNLERETAEALVAAQKGKKSTREIKGGGGR